jgi:hypothetical protein
MITPAQSALTTPGRTSAYAITSISRIAVSGMTGCSRSTRRQLLALPRFVERVATVIACPAAIG